MGLRWWLLGALVWASGVLALTHVASVPWWDANPFISDLPETSLTPGQVLFLCAVGLLSSMGLLIGSWWRGELGWRAATVLFTVAIGGMAVILHGLVLVPIAARGVSHPVRGELESLVVGSTWVTGVLCGFAVVTMGARERALRLVLGVFLLVGTLMVAKAVFERFIELPRTIALFESDSEATLLANDIVPGSSHAAIYERRLRNQQPGAWFGLANVLACFLAALTVLLATSLAAAVRDARTNRCSSGAAGVVGLLLASTAVAIWLTGSLGAMGMAFLVLLLLAAMLRFNRVRAVAIRYPGRAALLMGGVVLTGIIVRGLLLPASLERSVLFRWHYLFGTARVFMENLLTGTGPAGFQSEYTRLKPSISPENVQTPHVLIADWIGSYGLLGFAVVAGLLFWLWSVQGGDSASKVEDEQERTPLRAEFAWCLLVTACIIAAAFSVQWEVIGAVPDLLFVIVIALGFGATGLGVLHRVWHRNPAALRWAALGVAAVLIGHGMFDVAPARTDSAMLFWILVGAGVGPLGPAIARKRRQVLPVAVATVPLAAVTAWVGSVQMLRVEPMLAEAAEAVRERQYEFDPDPTGMVDYGIREMLSNARDDVPAGWLKLDLVRFWLDSRIAAHRGEGIDALSAAQQLNRRWPDSVQAHAAISAVLWTFRDDPKYGEEIRRVAIAAAIRTAGLAPHDPNPDYVAFYILLNDGQYEVAHQFAVQALKNQVLAQFDPLVGLSEAQLAELEDFLKEAGGE